MPCAYVRDVRAAVLCCPILLLLLHAAAAAIADDAPVLRIETGRHTAAILGLAVSRDGTKIATSSYDRTVRIWSMPDLKPLRIVRMPLGPSIEGAVYAVAFSPDGAKIATSGWTGGWGGDTGPWCIYIVNVADGAFDRTVCDMPHRANHLVYSPDGKYLAVALKKAAGLRVYRTEDYTLFAQDRDYSETSTFAEFDGDGRLLTTSYDGKVRLYDANLHLIASRAMPEGRRPESLSISPDGSRIAVAYDSPLADEGLLPPAVDVISSNDLSVQFRPDVRGMDNGALTRVVWSRDGSSLYAAGSWRRGTRHYIRRWAAGGRGAPRDIPGATSDILRLRPLNAGGVVFAAEVPTLVAIGPDDRIAAEQRSSIADYTDIGDHLAISEDGLTIQFAFESGGSKPANFSFLKRSLDLGEADGAKLVIPKTQAADLDIRDWARSDRPTLNGTPLEMQVYDQALAVAIAPDDKSFVLASKWKLYRYDSLGKLLWAKEVPFGARGVIITLDGSMVIAALGDGSIRWFRLDTGTELLAFFPEPAGRRWAAWTPSGYFMASVGGDNLIEWQVNRGRMRAGDHFSAGQFKDEFYRPSIVLKALAGLDEPRAIREANLFDNLREGASPSVLRLLPPVVQLLNLGDDEEITGTSLRIEYRVRAPSGAPVEEIIVRNDGYIYGTFTPPELNSAKEGTSAIEIIVPQRDSELLVFARNRFATSEPAVVHLKWSGKNYDIAIEQRKLYVLAIGASDYADEQLKLEFAAKDAADFATALSRQEGRAYSKVIQRVLRDATLAQVRSGLNWLGDSVDRDDIGIIFLAGHGVDLKGGVYHYLPIDADVSRLELTSLSYKELIASITRVAGHAVLFVDTCHAGDVFGQPGRPSIDTIGLVNRLSEPANGLVVFASSTGNQVAFESTAAKNGVFTKAVIEGLKGEGEAKFGRRNYITASMLQNFVKERVRDLTSGKQTPTINMPLSVPDILLARLSP
jgi:Caspase domain/WD domain, G-beta repeat